MNKKGNILIGVTASIAIYKTLEVISLLKKRGFSIRVAMTKEAAQFISPVVFQALTGSKAYINVLDEFDNLENTNITHIALSKWADVFAVVPATSNIIAKMANGFSDDAVSLVALATDAKKIIAPAMNSSMYLNPLTVENIEKLKERNFDIIEPVDGDLACNTKGIGHIADVCDIADAIESKLYEKPLENKTLIVTAGATIEPIDPVRYITNRSSGKMGYALAKIAYFLGADVTLISGETCLSKPYGVKLIKAGSAVDMLKKIKQTLKGKKEAIIIMASAVADFRPKNYIDKKIKKRDTNNIMNIELSENPDLTQAIKAFANQNGITLYAVGFAAETDDLIHNATEKIKKKGLNFIVANDVSRSDIGFNADDNEVSIIYENSVIDKLPKMDKESVAYEILRRIKV